MTSHENDSPITRERLYEEVWTAPMWTLATKYGLSDRGVARLCVREGIPVPPRGSWAKIQAGHAVPRPPLPPAPSPEASAVPIVEPVPPMPEPVEAPLFSPELDLLRSKLRADGPITMRDDLREQHAAIRSIIETRAKRRASLASPLDCPPWRSIRDAPGVSQALERHALRMLDALSRRAQDFGVNVEHGSHRGVAVKGALLGVEFTIYVYEPVKRVKFDPTPKDSYYDHEYRHTGRLELGFTLDGYGPDRAWQGSPERVAERLDEVLPALIVKVDNRLRTRAEWARHRQEEDERARQHAADEAARQAELRRRQQLLEESTMWRHVAIGREYVSAVQAALAERTAGGAADCEHKAWVTWARAALDRMDPIGRRLCPAPRVSAGGSTA